MNEGDANQPPPPQPPNGNENGQQPPAAGPGQVRVVLAGQSPLSEAEVTQLKQLLMEDFAIANEELDEEDLAAKVQLALPAAMAQKRAYDKAIKAFHMARERSNNLAQTIEKHLEAARAMDKGSAEARSELRRADRALKRFPVDVGAKLAAANDDAGLAWFGETVVFTVSILSEIQDQHDDYQVDYDEEMERHGFSDTPRNNQPYTLHEAKKPALQYDVSKVIGKKFSGEGDSKDVLLTFPPFKAKWLQLKEDLETKCSDVSDEIVYGKFKDCLDGQALVVANRAASYNEALEELCKKFEDRFELAGAYYEDLKPGMGISAHQQAAKAALNHVASIADEFEEEGVDKGDFLGIHKVCETMAPAAVKEWRAHILKSKEDYIRTHEQANDLAENPWKLGLVVNRRSFNLWYEAWALANREDEDDQSSVVSTKNVFLATGTSSQRPSFDCVFHGPGSHSTSHCKKALSMPLPEFKMACKKVGKCARCFKPFNYGHLSQCTGKCTICDGEHHMVSCSSNSARLPPRFPSAKRTHPDEYPRAEKRLKPANVDLLQKIADGQVKIADGQEKMVNAFLAQSSNNNQAASSDQNNSGRRHAKQKGQKSKVAEKKK